MPGPAAERASTAASRRPPRPHLCCPRLQAATMSAQLVWELVKKNNAFLRKSVRLGLHPAALSTAARPPASFRSMSTLSFRLTAATCGVCGRR